MDSYWRNSWKWTKGVIPSYNGRRVEVDLIFHRSELIYDIRNYAWVTGDVTDLDAEHVRHEIKDVGEDGNIERVTRVMNLSFEECADLLNPYDAETIVAMNADDGEVRLGETFELETLDNSYGAPEKYILRLMLPEEIKKGTIYLLKNLIHEYIVYRVIEDWFSIVGATTTQVWRGKIEGLSEKIGTLIGSRSKVGRRRLHPF